ncbi:hypothetical protein J8M21_20755 [Pseudoalteromonas luteoviolacea]|nr:hypothetical protein [Pseudoalteromonas luteoviolacea]
MVTDKLEKERLDVDAVVTRLYKHTGLSNERALSLEMGLSPGALYQAKKRGSLPWEGLIKYCKDNSISLDWLFDLETKQVAPLNNGIGNTSDEKLKSKLIETNNFVNSVMDEAIDKNLLPERMLEVRKALTPILFDAVVEYGQDKAIIAAVARSTLKLI